MRTVRVSKTARSMFLMLLRQSSEKFGSGVAEQKALLLEHCINNYLIALPQNGLKTRRKTFRNYPVHNTPFTDIYDDDDAKLRVLFIVHQRADLRRLMPAEVEW